MKKINKRIYETYKSMNYNVKRTKNGYYVYENIKSKIKKYSKNNSLKY